MRLHERKSVEHPLLPEEANAVLSIVAFLFASSGAFYLLALLVVMGGKLVGAKEAVAFVLPPLAVGIALLVAGGYLATAWLLAHRRRLGGVLGLGFTFLSIVGELFAPDPVGALDILLPAGLLVGLALSWTHLDD